MNKKIIVAAVAAAVLAPVAAQADMSVYGRVNNAISITDSGDDTAVNLSGIGSRVGLKGSSDLGNGLTASGQIELALDSAGTGGLTGGRVATAGISGSFGSITVGNQWSAFYDTAGTHIDPTYWIGAVASIPYRSENTIKYANSVGPLYFELDFRIDDSNNELNERLRRRPYRPDRLLMLMALSHLEYGN